MIRLPLVDSKANCVVGFWQWVERLGVTTKPENPKDDRIPLNGVAASFFVRRRMGTSCSSSSYFTPDRAR